MAASSSLPHGKGLADRFVADAGIAGNSSVVFAEDFERSDYQKNWRNVRDDSGVLALVTAPGSSNPDDSAKQRTTAPVGKQSLRVTASLTKNTGGGLTTWFESNDRLFIRFYVRFDKDVDYIHHFCTLRANKATHGKEAWSGFGGAGLKPQGTERFSTALEPWGDWGKNPPPGKFMLKHNTPGKPDGEQAWWVDGELIGHFKGINWRASGDLWANAFTLESYVTDRWTSTNVDAMPTIPAAQPSRQIDYILFRPAERWRVIETRVLDESVASDHRAIYQRTRTIAIAATIDLRCQIWCRSRRGS